MVLHGAGGASSMEHGLVASMGEVLQVVLLSAGGASSMEHDSVTAAVASTHRGSAFTHEVGHHVCGRLCKDERPQAQRETTHGTVLEVTKYGWRSIFSRLPFRTFSGLTALNATCSVLAV